MLFCFGATKAYSVDQRARGRGLARASALPYCYVTLIL